MPAAAVVGVASVAGTAYSSRKSSEAAKSASRAQERAAREAQEVSEERYQEARGMLDPYMTGEAEYYQRLREQFPETFQDIPGFEAQQQAFLEQQQAAQQYAQAVGAQIPQVQQQLGEVGDIFRGATEQYTQGIPGQLAGFESILGEAMGGARTGTEAAIAGLEQQQAISEEATAAALEGFEQAGTQYGQIGEELTGALGGYRGALGGSLEQRQAALADYETQLGASMGALDLLEQERLQAVTQAAAGAGELYSGRRGQAVAEVGGEMAMARAREQERLAGQLFGARGETADIAAQLAGQQFGAEAQTAAQQQGLVGAGAGLTAQELAAQQQAGAIAGGTGTAQQQAQLAQAQMLAGLGGQQFGAQQQAALAQLQAQTGLGGALAGLSQQQQALLQPLLQQQFAAQTGAAQAGGLAGAGQQAYWQDYMNRLGAMGAPQVTQNLAALGMGQAATQGQIGMQSAAQAGQLQMTAAQQQVAAMQGLGSVVGGLAMGGYLGERPERQNWNQFAQQYGFAPGYGMPYS